MKVYSWKTLLITIIFGVWIFIYEFEDLMAGEVSTYVFMLFYSYIILKCLWVSFTKEGFEEDKRKEANSKRVYRKLFGPWAIIAPWGHIILILLAALSVQILPYQKWLPAILIMGSVAYIIVVGRLKKKHLNIEEEIDKENSEDL